MAGLFELLLIKICLALFFAPSYQGILPLPKLLGRIGRHYVHQRQLSPLKTLDKLERVDKYENWMMRKSLHENVASSEEPLTLYTKIVLPANYDKNGMIFLTKPKNNNGINALMNKIINYKMAEKTNSYLRNNPQAVFDKVEVGKLREIVGSIERDERSQDDDKREIANVPNIVFEFSDLVA